jgi:hypothetical protein
MLLINQCIAGTNIMHQKPQLTRNSGNKEKTRFIQHMNIGISRPLFCAKGMSKMPPRAMLKNI